MKNQRAAGAYVFSPIVDSLWIAKMTLKSFLKVINGGRTDETANIFTESEFWLVY